MTHEWEFPVKAMCMALKVSRSGYYEWRTRKPSKRVVANQQLLEEIKSVYEESDGTYGSPRVTAELRARGAKCSSARVARIMRLGKLVAAAGRRFKPQTTNSNHSEPVSENIINQDFSATEVGEKVGCDITYIPTTEGWVYLAVVIDFYSRMVLGYAFAESLESGLVCEALLKAASNHKLPRHLIHHSDRGVQYASARYRALIKSLGMNQSMSRAGNCYDNALVESFFHTLKVERICRRKYHSKNIAIVDVRAYINNWYNHKRRHSSLGMASPMEFIHSRRLAA